MAQFQLYQGIAVFNSGGDREEKSSLKEKEKSI